MKTPGAIYDIYKKIPQFKPVLFNAPGLKSFDLIRLALVNACVMGYIFNLYHA